jgi:hypothetical protein
VADHARETEAKSVCTAGLPGGLRTLRVAPWRAEIIEIIWQTLQVGKLIADETEKWGKVIRAANIKAD